MSSIYLSMSHNSCRSSIMIKEIGPRKWSLWHSSVQEKPLWTRITCHTYTLATVVQKDSNHLHSCSETDFCRSFSKRMLWVECVAEIDKDSCYWLTCIKRDSTVHECNAEINAYRVDRLARHPSWWSTWEITSCKIHFLTNDSRILTAVGKSEIGRK